MSCFKLKKHQGFSLLEMLLAMSIFAIVGLSVFQMFSLLADVQTYSLGVQHFKNKGYSLVNRLEQELSEAVAGDVFIYEQGKTIVNEGDLSTTTKKVRYNAEFKCFVANAADIRTFNPGSGVNDNKDGIQQIYFLTYSYEKPVVGDIEYFIEKGDNKFFFDKVRYKEKIIYQDNKVSGQDPEDYSELNMYVREEKIENGEINLVTGSLNAVHANGKDEKISNKIEKIEYLFWGNSSESWNDDGSGDGNPIREWDSTIKEDNSSSGNIHQINELPRAMKVVLTLKYNPEIYQKREEDLNPKKDQYFVFERIVLFKNRGKS